MSQLTTQRVQTFCVGFDVPNYSELPYARLAAEHFGTEHHELVVTCSDLSKYWPLLTWHRDEPVSEPSDLGVYLVSKLARQYVKVVLSGEGGDELFAGYPKYVVDWIARYYHVLPTPIRDKMMMAASLEGRIPLLDYRLIEYAASIPSNIKIKGLKPKYLLKRAFADFLPDAILTRKKMGFNVPTGTWFREGQRDLIMQLLLSERARSRGYLNAAFVARLVRDHLEGRANYQAQLFALASLELWFRVFVDAHRLERPYGTVEELLESGEKLAVPGL